jgi:hypothetical protein
MLYQGKYGNLGIRVETQIEDEDALLNLFFFT